MRVRPTRWDIAVSAGLAIVYLGLLLATMDIGFPRDEGFYFNAGEMYSYWYDDLFEDPAKAFTQKSVDRHFEYNPEHPALPKMLFGASWRLFGKMHDPANEPWAKSWYHRGSPPKQILGIMSESTAMRLPALLLNSFLVFALYLFALRHFGRTVAIATTAVWMFQPHAFWHAHLAAFDMPITVMWFLTVAVFAEAIIDGPNGKRRWGFIVLTGVVWGFALNTKLNAFFIPATLVLWWLVARWREAVAIIPFKGRKARWPRIPLAFFSMLIISPIVYYIFWPKLWFDPIEHMKFYIPRHAKHEYYWAYFFNTLYVKPPFPVSFPFVMSAMTLPAPTIVIFTAGVFSSTAKWLKDRFPRSADELSADQDTAKKSPDSGIMSLVAINTLIPFAIIAVPTVPIFGGTKHWLPAMPFLAIFAGIGFEWLIGAISNISTLVTPARRGVVRGVVIAIAAVGLLGPAVWDTLHGHTNGSTYYNGLFGGHEAMGRYGMQREFWGNTAFSTLGWLNTNAKKNARVHFHDTAWDSVRFYLRDGLLRKDLKTTWDFNNSDIFLFHWHKEFLDLEAEGRNKLGNPVPVHVVEQDGAVLLNVYAKPGAIVGGEEGAR